MGLLANSFFDGVEKFVEFEKLFVHVDGGSLELLDFFGALLEVSKMMGIWQVLLFCLTFTHNS